MVEKRLDDRSDFYNRLLLLAVVFVIVSIPTYIGVMTAICLTYGIEQFIPMLVQPELMLKTTIALAEYWFHYKAQLPPDYTVKILGPMAGSVLVIIGILFAARAPLLDFRPFKPKESIHGDAHWADKKEIAKAGLFSKNGVLLGQYKKGKYYIADGYQHILLFAPTGSGKGVGFAIPNLLFWDQSCCVHDIKLENYDLCSGWRAKQGQSVYVWNPADPNGVTHCYNPMDWISTKPGQMVDDVQKIANLILPEQEFWQNEARSLFVGVVLYLCAVPEKLTSFGEVVRTMRSDDVNYNLAVVLDTIGKKIHPVAYMNIAAFLQKADKERSGVVSTMNSGLELWANPLIDTATASSDFSIMEWKKKKITVYCGVTPDNLQRLQPLLQVFYQQASDILTRHMPTADEPYGVLFLMDEFPTLGKMPQFEAGIAYFRGYKMRLFLIVQDTQQLKGIYEEAGMNSFLSNATYRITFAANNVETANLISQLIGNKTVRQESHNMPKFLDLNPAARTKHVSEIQRALLLPQEVIQLPRDEQIILIESQPPIKSKKIKYYDDPFFTKRLLEKTFVPVQEPYDPRKKDEKKDDKPSDKPDGKAGKSNTPTKPNPPKPPAPAAAPPAQEPKKNPFDVAPKLPKPDEEKPKDDKPKAAASPFDTPPKPAKKEPDPAPGFDIKTKDNKPITNPFDAPNQLQASKAKPGEPTPEKYGPEIPEPTTPDGKTKSAPASPFDAPAAPKPTEAAKPAPASPFDAPAAPKPTEAAKSASANPFDAPAAPKPTEAAKPAPASPFDAPAAPKPTEAAKPASANPFDAPAAPKPTEAAKPAPASPFDAPAAPKPTEVAISENKADSSNSDEDSSASGGVPPATAAKPAVKPSGLFGSIPVKPAAKPDGGDSSG